MRIKRVLAINDMSGIGRCSLTALIPTISAMGSQVVPVPTALLSSHTGYSNVSFLDLTDNIDSMVKKYIENGEGFDAVATGFLGSERQGRAILATFDAFPYAYKFVDPVMGDGGELYPTYTKAMCDEIRQLCSHADIVTPNLTEACILAGVDYCGESADDKALQELALKIHALGAKEVIITGVVRDDGIITFGYDGHEFFSVQTPIVSPSFPGTGDLFAGVLLGGIMRGDSTREACTMAAQFVCEGIKFSSEQGLSPLEGIAFEPLLKKIVEKQINI